MKNKKHRKLVWQYFNEIDGYIPQCKKCNYTFKSKFRTEILEPHLIRMHLEIIADIKKIKHTWVSRYFDFDIKDHPSKIKCNNCDRRIDNIFNEVQTLITHMNKVHIIYETNSTEENNPDVNFSSN